MWARFVFSEARQLSVGDVGDADAGRLGSVGVGVEWRAAVVAVDETGSGG
jgi:hypothetical protein